MVKENVSSKFIAAFLAITIGMSLVSLATNENLISVTYGYGYSYGISDNNSETGADFGKIDLKIKNGDLTGKKTTTKKKVTLKFEDVDNQVTYFKISRNDDFGHARWEKIDDSIKLNLEREKSGKVKFYVKFKDGSGNESKTLSQTIYYKPVVKNKLETSQDNVKFGDILTQKGKGFKKNANVLVYFTKADGSYYSPTVVKTDNKGNFILTYNVNKSVGTYAWYAVNELSGRKSKISTYTIVR